MSLCAPESTGEQFGDVLELSLEAVSQQSPQGRQSQAGLSGIQGNGSPSAVSHQEKWQSDHSGFGETFLTHLERGFVPNICGFQLEIRSRETVPLLIDEQSEAGGGRCCRRSLRPPWAGPGVSPALARCPGRGWIGCFT